jgi:hypothetical protein
MYYPFILRGEHALPSTEGAIRYKPEGSIFDSRRDHWIFNCPNFQPQWTQPLTEISTRDLPVFKGCRWGKADNFTDHLWIYRLNKFWSPGGSQPQAPSLPLPQNSESSWCTVSCQGVTNLATCLIHIWLTNDPDDTRYTSSQTLRKL